MTGTASPFTSWSRCAATCPQNTPAPRCASRCPRSSHTSFRSCCTRASPTSTRRPTSASLSTPSSRRGVLTTSSAPSATSYSDWPLTSCTYWATSTTADPVPTSSWTPCSSTTRGTYSGATTTFSGWGPRQATTPASATCCGSVCATLTWPPSRSTALTSYHWPPSPSKCMATTTAASSCPCSCPATRWTRRRSC